MRALEFWKTVTVDKSNLLDRLIARLIEARPHLRTQVPDAILARLVG